MKKRERWSEWSGGSNCGESDKTPANSGLRVGTEPSARSIHRSQVIIKNLRESLWRFCISISKSVQFWTPRDRIVSFVIENVRTFCQRASFKPLPLHHCHSLKSPPPHHPLHPLGRKQSFIVMCQPYHCALKTVFSQLTGKTHNLFLDWIKSPNPALQEGREEGGGFQHFFVYRVCDKGV